MKIHFLVFYKDENCISKCVESINNLHVPENIEIDILGISDGDSICEAYECGRIESDADIKVYIRENVYIVNQNFIHDIIDYFENNPTIDVAGLIGGVQTDNFIEWNCGRIDICNEDRMTRFCGKKQAVAVDFDAILGTLIVVKGDGAWNEDDTIDDRYFDIDFCKKVKACGGKLGVFPQYKPWCIWEYGKAFGERYDVFTDDGEAWAYCGEKPLVSVVMICYNSENYMSDGIESILNQTYDNLEIILVDACSDDQTKKIIGDYALKDVRIKPLYLEENYHVCKNGNIANEMATGKYLALIGHDDMWRNNKIEQQVAFLEKRTDVDVCFTTVHVIDDDKNIIDKEDFYYGLFKNANASSERMIRHLYLEGNCLCAPSSLIRVSKIPKPFYMLDTVQLQDYELWLRMLLNGNIYTLNEDLTLYRHFINDGSNLSSMESKSELTPKKIRNYHELCRIKYRFLMNMEEKQFLKIFRDMLIDPNCDDPKSVLCEKAYLLYITKNRYFMDVYSELFMDEEAMQILEEKYEFSLLEFYEMETKIIV